MGQTPFHMWGCAKTKRKINSENIYIYSGIYYKKAHGVKKRNTWRGKQNKLPFYSSTTLKIPRKVKKTN